MINLINRCVPETPSFLLYTHQEEKAERALQWLRGEEADVSAEMATIHGNIRRMREQGADCRRVLVPQLVRPLLLTCGLMFFHRFVTLQYAAYHPLEGRGFMCFVFDPASLHGPKPKHTKPLPPSG